MGMRVAAIGSLRMRGAGCCMAHCEGICTMQGNAALSTKVFVLPRPLVSREHSKYPRVSLWHSCCTSGPNAARKGGKYGSYRVFTHTS